VIAVTAQYIHSVLHIGIKISCIGNAATGPEDDFGGLGSELTAAADTPACTITGHP
jgi:hypothetical protein